MAKKIPQIGIVTCILYFIAVTLFLITKTEIALTIWELFTIIGAPVILFVLIELANLMKIPTNYTNAMLVFMSCTCSLTALAHIINISVTRKLLADDVNVPNYLRIGYWPSVEMATDYLAWGFFMGLAFLSVGFAINRTNKQNSMTKLIVLISGTLCLSGFWGTIFVNENLWYLAPLGYGFGTIFICIKMIGIENETQ
ncbi:MAG: hypothetical protein ACERKZ_04535 [Lachnotalea sp.]